jgi:tRNA A37 methylthiotransferase MiaB
MKFNKRFIGKNLSVLLENGKDRKTGFLKGFSDNYVPVLIPDSNVSMSNHIVKVRAESLRGGKILGRKAIDS